jgi:hypothetical protein
LLAGRQQKWAWAGADLSSCNVKKSLKDYTEFQFYLKKFIMSQAQMSSNDQANKLLTAKGADGDAAIPFCGCICCFNACYTG